MSMPTQRVRRFFPRGTAAERATAAQILQRRAHGAGSQRAWTDPNEEDQDEAETAEEDEMTIVRRSARARIVITAAFLLAMPGLWLFLTSLSVK
jgi:hypothetical protein